VHPALRLVRIGNVAVSFFGTVVAGLVALGVGLAVDGPVAVALVLAAGSTACVTAAGNTLNDVLDQATDRVNHPDRPLVTGAVSERGARRLVAALFIVALALVVPEFPTHPWLLPILAAAIGSLLLYEYRWKSQGLRGNVLVAGLTAAVFLYGGAVTPDLLLVVPLAAMAFGATLSRELIKDMEDAAGDEGRATVPRVYGPSVAAGIAWGAVLVAIGLSALPLLWFVGPRSVAGIMYTVLVVASDAVFVASVAMLPNRLHLEQTLSKGAMTIALVAFLATAFR